MVPGDAETERLFYEMSAAAWGDLTNKSVRNVVG